MFFNILLYAFARLRVDSREWQDGFSDVLDDWPVESQVGPTQKEMLSLSDFPLFFVHLLKIGSLISDAELVEFL